MPWRKIRQATDEDRSSLAETARDFCRLHKLAIPDNEPDPAAFVLRAATPPLFRLWRQCAARATGEPGAEGIEDGYIGFRPD